MSELRLIGCRPEPLASYLKAVGVLRILADQFDGEVRGRWEGESFWLRTSADRPGLLDFFTNAWCPTPLVSPWNAGSGFKQEKNPAAVNALTWVAASTDPRLLPYRAAIAEGQRIHADATAGQWSKRRTIESCRNRLPDEALAWLDASVVLTNDDEVFPPLLGTGGNDGRFDFTVAHMSRLSDVLDGSTQTSARSRAWLAAALFNADAIPLLPEAVGQFDPGAAGGVNASSTGWGGALVNPWDWLLCLEGALSFASASARRLGSVTRGRAAVPFTLGPAPVGYVTGSREEPARGELWTPLWSRWATAREITRLLGEGRVEWRGAQAANGLDAARALADLGVDRGVHSFVRHALVSRNGLATLAVPVGRLVVHRRAEVSLTGQLDRWLGAIRRDSNPPAAVRTGLNRLEAAMFALAVRGGRGRLQDVLLRAAELDTAVGRSPTFRSDARVGPLLLRDLDGWVNQLHDGTPEFRLAVGFASLRDRIGEGRPWTDRQTLGRLLRPLRHDDRTGRLVWSEAAEEVRGFGARPVLNVLADLHVRRGVLVADRVGDEDDDVESVGIQPAYDNGERMSLDDVAALLSGGVDLDRLEAILMALLRLDWAATRQADRATLVAEPLSEQRPPSAFVLLAPSYLSRRRTLAWTSGLESGDTPLRVRASPDWLPRLRAGQVGPVLDAAASRLRLAGVDLAVGRHSRLAAGQMSALALGMDGPALGAALLLRVHPGDLTRGLRRLAPFESTTLHAEETA